MNSPGPLRTLLLWGLPGLALVVGGYSLGSYTSAWLGVLVCVLAGRLAYVASRDGHYRLAVSGCLFPALIAVLGIPWLITAGVVAGRAMAKSSATFVDVAALLLVAALHFGSERVYGRLTMRSMGEKTGDTPQGRALDPTEVDAPTGELSFVEHDADSQLPPHELGDRIADQLERPGSERFYRGLLLALATSTLVTLVMFGYLTWQADAAFVASTFETHGPLGRIAMFLQLVSWQAPSIVVAFAMAITVKYARGSVGWRTALICLAVANMWKLALTGVITMNGTKFTPMSGPRLAPVLAAAPAVALLVLVSYSITIWLRDRRERSFVRRLVVLRVFGVLENTRNLFKNLASRWQSTGPVLTIADPGYARIDFRRGRFLILLVASAPIIVVTSLLGSTSATVAFVGFYGPAFVALYTPALLIYFALRFLALRTRFARNVEAVRQRIAFESLQDGWLTKRYRTGTAYCYDDIWKTALGELVAWSDVVLMDLRGFGPTRRGCLFELDYLVDCFPLDRALFLVDQSTDLVALQHALAESWRHVVASSPNRLHAPTVTFYRASGALRREVPRLVDLLGRAAARVSEQGPRLRAITDAERYARAARIAGLVGNSLIALGIALQALIYVAGLDWGWAGVSLSWRGLMLRVLVWILQLLLQRDGTLRRMVRRLGPRSDS